MTHRASGRGPRAWLGVALAFAVYGGAAFALITYEVDFGFEVPWWGSLAVPPLGYLLLGLIAGRRAPMRGLGAAVALCALHALLVTATASARTIAESRVFERALMQAAWGSPLLSAVQLVCSVLALLPFRHLLAGRSRVARAARPARPVAPVAPRMARPAAPTAAARAAEPAPAPVVAPPAAIPTPAPSAPAPPRDEAAATVPPAAPPATSGPRTMAAEAVDEVVRIPFERIAGQLPVSSFVLPPERLAANLLEPGYLLVPRRLVVPQLADGFVQVAWSVVADQFPGQARAISDAEIAQRIPEGVLALPLDEILRQLSPDAWALSSPTMDVNGIEDFPPPFQPHVPPPQEEVVELEREDLGPEPEPIPEVIPEPPPLAAPVPAPPAVRAPLPLALPPLLAPLQADTIVRDDVRLLTLTSPSVDREAAVGLALRVLPFLGDPRLPTPAEQGTIRSERFAAIVTPLDDTTALVVAVDAPARLALLERWSLDAAAASGRTGARTPRGAPRWDGEGLVDDHVPSDVRAVTEVLASFGPLAPSVLRDPSGANSLYVFLPAQTPPQPIADVARDLMHALGGAGAVSVVFRQRRERLIVQPVHGGPESAVLVAGGGPIARPGLARLEVARATRRLAAR